MTGSRLSSLSINGMEFGVDTKIINITEGPSPPDISVTPLAIWFSDPVPDGGDVVDITARVNNTGGRSVSGALVRFLDGPELTGDIIGEVEIDVSASSSALATTSWDANPGIHAITVILDPDDLLARFKRFDLSIQQIATVAQFQFV